MDETLRKSLMFDFYGPLLTERQQDIYEMYYAQDMSLGEIGEQLGISRQAVYDIIKRSSAQLEEFEDKLGLLSKFLRQQMMLAQMEEQLQLLIECIEQRDVSQSLMIVAQIQELISKIRNEA